MGVIIIAEGGVNHNGSVGRALEMIRVAADAGVDYIKFQTFKAEKLVSKSAKKAEYQIANCDTEDDSQLAMLKSLELTAEDFKMLAEECRRCGIGFMSTPFDMESIDVLAELDMDYWKIPSGEITNLPYLRKIAQRNEPIILSTGMCETDEIEESLKAIELAGTPRSKVTLLHCTTQYPAPYGQLNLRAMQSLESFGCSRVGYSDHSEGITAAVVAVALGAKVIEKHFTLDKTLPGPDHVASLSPDELSEMVKAIRLAESSLGTGVKTVADAERPNIAVARKSIVASRPIVKDEVFSEDNLTTKRPATGLSPMLWDTVVGKTANRDFAVDEAIEI